MLGKAVGQKWGASDVNFTCARLDFSVILLWIAPLLGGGAKGIFAHGGPPVAA